MATKTGRSKGRADAEEVLKKAWLNAKNKYVKEPDFGSVPPGIYICRLTGAEIKESQKGNLGANFQFTIVNGEMTGHIIFKWDGMETEENLYWIFKDLAVMGVDVEAMPMEDPIAEVEEVLEELLGEGPYLRIECKQSGDYINKYLRAKLDSDEVEEDAPGSDDTDSGSDDGDDDSTYTEGDSITWNGDSEGEELSGTIVAEYEDGDYQVQDEEGNLHDVSPDDILGKASGTAVEPDGIEKGSRVLVKWGDEMYPGKVKKVLRDGEAFLILFDDGDKEEVDAADCELVDEE